MSELAEQKFLANVELVEYLFKAPNEIKIGILDKYEKLAELVLTKTSTSANLINNNIDCFSVLLNKKVFKTIMAITPADEKLNYHNLNALINKVADVLASKGVDTDKYEATLERLANAIGGTQAIVSTVTPDIVSTALQSFGLETISAEEAKELDEEPQPEIVDRNSSLWDNIDDMNDDDFLSDEGNMEPDWDSDEDTMEPDWDSDEESGENSERNENEGISMEELMHEDDNSSTEGQQSDETKTSDAKPSPEYFKRKMLNTVQDIKIIYDALFASGYSVIEQYGVLCNVNGGGAIISLQGDRIKVTEDSAFNDLYNLYSSVLQLKESSKRVIGWADIQAGYNYFPYKLLEFVFGRYTAKPEDIEINRYCKHASSKTWAQYWDNVVEKNILDMLNALVTEYLNSTDKTDKTELGDLVQDVLDKFKYAITPCIIVSEYTPGNIKFRISDPLNKINQDTLNNITQQTLVAIGSTNIDKPKDVSSGIVRGAVKEIEIKTNPKLCGVIPLFARDALEKLVEQGQKISWDHVIMGKSEDDDVYIANDVNNDKFKLNFNTQSVIHISAGSRSGKGVMTLNILASAIASGIPVFYIDCKPDMASVLKYMTGGKMFVVNGSTYNKTFDPYNVYANNGIGKVRVPNGRFSMLSQVQWNALQYMKAVHFCLQMSCVIGNLMIPEATTDTHMLTIVDELWQGQNGIANAFDSIVDAYTKEKNAGKNADKEKMAFLDGLFNWRKQLKSDFTAARDIDLTGKNPTIVTLYQADVCSNAAGVKRTNAAVFKDDGKENPMQGNRTLYRALTDLGKVGLVGYNKDNPHQLYSTDKGRKYLTETDRYFAYTPDIEDELAYLGENETQYFKPFLILNDTEREDVETSPLGTLKKNLRNAGVDPEACLGKYRDSNGKLDESIGFIGYIKKLSAVMGNGLTPEQVLKKSYDLSNYVLNKIGYFEATGATDVFDYLYDFRPEYLLSKQQIMDMLTNGTKIGQVDPDGIGGSKIDNIAFGVSNNASETGSSDTQQSNNAEEELLDFGSPTNTTSNQPQQPLSDFERQILNQQNTNKVDKSIKFMPTKTLMQQILSGKMNDETIRYYFEEKLLKQWKQKFNLSDKSNNPTGKGLLNLMILYSNMYAIEQLRQGLVEVNTYLWDNVSDFEVNGVQPEKTLQYGMYFNVIKEYANQTLKYDTIPNQQLLNAWAKDWADYRLNQGSESQQVRQGDNSSDTFNGFGDFDEFGDGQTSFEDAPQSFGTSEEFGAGQGQQTTAGNQQFNPFETNYSGQYARDCDYEAPHQQVSYTTGNNGVYVFNNLRPTSDIIRMPSNTIVMQRLGFLERIKKKAYESRHGMSYMMSKYWDNVLQLVVNEFKGDKLRVNRLAIISPEITANQVVISIDSILGGEDNIELREIINIHKTLKKFPNIQELMLDNEGKSALLDEYGADAQSIWKMFRENPKLQRLTLVTSEGGLQRYDRSSFANTARQLDSELETEKAKKLLDVAVANKHPRLSSEPGVMYKAHKAMVGNSVDYFKKGHDIMIGNGDKKIRKWLGYTAGGLGAVALGGVLGIPNLVSTKFGRKKH